MPLTHRQRMIRCFMCVFLLLPELCRVHIRLVARCLFFSFTPTAGRRAATTTTTTTSLPLSPSLLLPLQFPRLRFLFQDHISPRLGGNINVPIPPLYLQAPPLKAKSLPQPSPFYSQSLESLSLSLPSSPSPSPLSHFTFCSFPPFSITVIVETSNLFHTKKPHTHTHLIAVRIITQATVTLTEYPTSCFTTERNLKNYIKKKNI